MENRVKKVVLLSLASALVVGACGNNESSESVEVAVTDQTVDQTSDITESHESLSWIQLGLLDTHPSIRQAIDNIYDVKVRESGEHAGLKNGPMYIGVEIDYSQEGEINSIRPINTSNTNLLLALGNASFSDGTAWDELMESASDIASSEYTDVEDDEAFYAVLNAYFECLPDSTAGEFNGDESLSRGQAMTLVTRATQKVPDSGIPAPNTTFTSKVGSNAYTDYAAQVDKQVYINLENGLSESTFNSTISKGEYICLLMNTLYKDSAEAYNNLAEADLTSIKDAGAISLADAVKDADKGCPSDMHVILAKAVTLGAIADDFEWDTALTKVDAMKLFIDTAKAYYDTEGYLSTSQTAQLTESASTSAETAEAVKQLVDDLAKCEGDQDKIWRVCEATDLSLVDISTNYDALYDYFMFYHIFEQAGFDLNDYESMYDMQKAFRQVYNDGNPKCSMQDAYKAYAKSKGADGTVGLYYFKYARGSAAGDGHTYYICQITGQRYDAGPGTILPHEGGNMTHLSEGIHDEEQFNQHLLLVNMTADEKKHLNTSTVPNPFPDEVYNYDTMRWEKMTEENKHLFVSDNRALYGLDTTEKTQ